MESEPNHLMLIAAASPIIDNANKNRTYQPQEPFNLQTLPKALERANLSWATYGDAGFSYFSKINELKGSPNIQPWTNFDSDVAAGKLPSVSWVYAPGKPVKLSEHPPFAGNAGQPTVKLGSQWTADRVSTLGKSKLWAHSVIFITWDDWGGWHDHIDPPPLKEREGVRRTGPHIRIRSSVMGRAWGAW